MGADYRFHCGNCSYEIIEYQDHPQSFERQCPNCCKDATFSCVGKSSDGGWL